MTKLIAAEVAKRNFIKKNGQGNENEFFNKMLPNMLAYRAYKKGYLRKYLDKNIKESISEGMQEKILDFLAESFDYLYFDESEYACDDVVVAFPVALEYSVKKEHWYVLYFTENKFDTLYATPLYGISKILLRAAMKLSRRPMCRKKYMPSSRTKNLPILNALK